MRIIFMGTPDFAVPTLDALVAAGHDIACVYTQPPRPAHRGRREQPGAVLARATALGLRTRTPTTLKSADEQSAFAALDADVAIVAAYGLILPPPILAATPLGAINVHGSILPRWRGAAPVQRAILAGDVETGVAIMQMEAGLDTGPVRAEARIPASGKTAGQLTDELARLGAALLVDTLADIDAHPPLPQGEAGVTYATKISKDEARIDWNLSAVQVERTVRAFNPTPGAWCEIGGERIKILAAELVAPQGDEGGTRPGTVVGDGLLIACNPGLIRPTLVQRAGRGQMSTAELLRGFDVATGTALT